MKSKKILKFRNLQVGECFTFPHFKDEVANEYMKTQSYKVSAKSPCVGIQFNSVVTFGDKIGHIRFIERNFIVWRV